MYTNDEEIIWAQQRVNDDTWRDIVVPESACVQVTAPPTRRKVTITEWGDMLKKSGTTGIFRAYTSCQNILILTVAKKHYIDYEVEDVTR